MQKDMSQITEGSFNILNPLVPNTYVENNFKKTLQLCNY